jgi:hypothetical protein
VAAAIDRSMYKEGEFQKELGLWKPDATGELRSFDAVGKVAAMKTLRQDEGSRRRPRHRLNGKSKHSARK